MARALFQNFGEMLSTPVNDIVHLKFPEFGCITPAWNDLFQDNPQASERTLEVFKHVQAFMRTDEGAAGKAFNGPAYGAYVLASAIINDSNQYGIIPPEGAKHLAFRTLAANHDDWAANTGGKASQDFVGWLAAEGSFDSADMHRSQFYVQQPVSGFDGPHSANS